MEGKQKISETQKRVVVRMDLKGKDNARTIQAELKLRIGHRRVQQILRAVPIVKFNIMKTAPQMTPHHKENRKMITAVIIITDDASTYGK